MRFKNQWNLDKFLAYCILFRSWKSCFLITRMNMFRLKSIPGAFTMSIFSLAETTLFWTAFLCSLKMSSPTTPVRSMRPCHLAPHIVTISGQELLPFLKITCQSMLPSELKFNFRNLLSAWICLWIQCVFYPRIFLGRREARERGYSLWIFVSNSWRIELYRARYSSFGIFWSNWLCTN